jgi:HK97 family phage major capsid protein
MDMSVVTKSVEEIATLARQTGANVEKQMTEFGDFKKAIEQRVLDAEQKISARARAGATGGGGNGLPSFAKTIAADEQVIALQAGRTKHAHIELPMSIKGLITNLGQDGDSPEQGVPSASEFIAPTPLQAPGQRLAVLYALTHRTVGAATATIPKITGVNDNAAPQANEGAQKLESQLSFTGEVLRMETIATWAAISKQVITDVGALLPFLSMFLKYYVLRKLENLIIAGNGTSDKIAGLITQGVIYGAASDHAADRIGEAASVGLPAHGYSASLIVLNPYDLFRILSARDANQRYVGAGWLASFSGSLWGIPTAASVGCPIGTAIVLDKALVEVLDRYTAVVEIGYTGTQFTQNEATVLAELRSNLGIYDPNGVMIVTLPANSPAEVG